MDQRLSYIPNLNPIITWDFTNGRLPERCVFNRNTEAYSFCTGYQATGGNMETTGSPRFVNNMITGGGRGLLLERSSTNTQKNSSSGFSLNNGATISTANGRLLVQMNRQTFNEGTAALSGTNYPAVSAASNTTIATGTTVTYSFILERFFTGVETNAVNWVNIKIIDGNFVGVYEYRFDLNTGAIQANDQTTITAVPLTVNPLDPRHKGWRVSITQTLSGGYHWWAISAMNDDGYTYANPGRGRTFNLIHVQSENLPYPTSPILTTGTEVTRAADVLRLHGLVWPAGLSPRYSFLMEVESRFWKGTAGNILSVLPVSGFSMSVAPTNSGNSYAMNTNAGQMTNSLAYGLVKGAGFTIAGGLGASSALAINGNTVGASASNGNIYNYTPEVFCPFGELSNSGTEILHGSQVLKSLRIYDRTFTEQELGALTR